MLSTFRYFASVMLASPRYLGDHARAIEYSNHRRAARPHFVAGGDHRFFLLEAIADIEPGYRLILVSRLVVWLHVIPPEKVVDLLLGCLLYTSPSPRDRQ